jgi:hypothetical protein
LDFLKAVPTPLIVTFEARPILRELLNQSKSGPLAVEVLWEFCNALPSLNRLVLLEVLHIAAMICENSFLNKCDPIRVCSALAEVTFAEQYVVVMEDDDNYFNVDLAKLFMMFVQNRRQLTEALSAPPPMGQSIHELLHCLSMVRVFAKEKVRDLAFAEDGSCCVVGSSGSIRVQDCNFMLLNSAKAAQPLFCVQHVPHPGPTWWVRGEMYAEVRIGDPEKELERSVKLPRNVRSFLYLPQLNRVWGGSEGLIYVFNADTGAESGASISFSTVVESAPVSETPSANASGYTTPHFLRQESAMVDEEGLANLIGSLNAPIDSLQGRVEKKRLSNTVIPTAVPGKRNARLPVKMLVATDDYVWACGDSHLRVYPLCDPPPPNALASFDEPDGKDFSGMVVVEGGKTNTVAVVCSSGSLFKFTLDKSCVLEKKELKTSYPLKLLAGMGENMLISTSPKRLHVFHLEFWKHIGTVSTQASPVTCLETHQVSEGYWELCSGHEDGSVKRWAASADGFAAASSVAWKRASSAPEGRAGVSFFTDARNGSSISPEEVVIDRSRAIDSEMFGLVYKGEFRARSCSVKELSLEGFSDQEVEEFTEHLDSLKVPDRAWCPLYCYSVSSKQAILVTGEWKTSLYNLLKEGKMRQRLRMQIAEQVSSYLALLHSQDPPLLHLDITTSSVVIGHDLNAQVDNLYSLGRVRNKHTDKDSPKLFRSQRVLPPEMLEGKEPTTASDVYQFGMLLWSLIAQDNPFHQVISLSDLYERVVVKNQRPVIPNSCPVGLRAVLLQCWHQDPAQRPTLAALVEQQVFAKAYLEHSLGDAVAVDFWINFVCKASEATSLLQPVSLRLLCQQIMVSCQVDQKTGVLLEEMFKNFLVHQGKVSVADFGEMLVRFGQMDMSKEWAEGLVDQLTAPGMFGSISSDTADEHLQKGKRGDYLLRFTRAQKGAFQLHVKGSEGVRTYLIVPKDGKWKLKESASNIFSSLDDLIKHYQSQFNLKNPSDNSVFQLVYNKVMGVEKKRGLFSKRQEVIQEVPGSNYTTSFDD